MPTQDELNWMAPEVDDPEFEIYAGGTSLGIQSLLLLKLFGRMILKHNKLL